ncbi:MAG: class IV adenylate cyclase [Phototrophicaceae bacterium]
MAASNQYTEIEIKLHVSDLSVIQHTLQVAGATLTKPRVFERNWRYDFEDRSLSSTGQVLRLRQDADIRLTYKSGKKTHALESGIVERQEIEVSLNNFEAMDRILQMLGYIPYMSYEKYRTTYVLDGAEIVLDELPYGSFVEIEASSGAEIERLVSELGLGSYPRFSMSYSSIFQQLKDVYQLDFDDLTFENFDGLTVSLKHITGYTR